MKIPGERFERNSQKKRGLLKESRCVEKAPLIKPRLAGGSRFIATKTASGGVKYSGLFFQREQAKKREKSKNRGSPQRWGRKRNQFLYLKYDRHQKKHFK